MGTPCIPFLESGNAMVPIWNGWGMVSGGGGTLVDLGGGACRMGQRNGSWLLSLRGRGKINHLDLQ